MNNLNFRAWHKELKEVEQVLLMCFVNQYVNVLPARNLEGGSQEQWNFKDVVLMQSTGLKDSKGVEIFEGDICKMSYTAYDDIGKYKRNFIGKVAFIASRGACLKNPTYYYSRESKISPVIENAVEFITKERFVYPGYKDLIAYQSTIIGNIYQNPELLEVENEYVA